jgi:Xaa-Pro aminopeptidase
MATTNDELARARAETAATCDFVLLSSLANVTYVSGFEVPHPLGVTGAVPYAGSFAAFAVAGEQSVLGVPVSHRAPAERDSRLEGLVTFATFDSFQPEDPRASYLDALQGALLAAGLGTGALLGIEGRALPAEASAAIARGFPGVVMVDVGEALDRARRVKTPREIEKLRGAARVGDAGHRALAELVALPGRSECELYALVAARMWEEAGHEISVVGELVTGPRTCTVAYPGGPWPRTTERGDAALMDISQRIDGYWSDCTNTRLIGGGAPTPGQRRLVDAAQSAFEAIVGELRPGRRASDAWRAAAAVYRTYGVEPPHYGGHQIGALVNELPRIVPYDDSAIQAGMVFAVEPGAYEGPGGRFGVRFEKMVLVTASEPEVLSRFDWGL